MLSPGNVATPATAATVVVPERVPLPGFAPSATVTFPVKPVAVFPCPSSAVTCTARSEAHTSALQSHLKLIRRLLLAPAVMLNGVEVIPLRLPLFFFFNDTAPTEIYTLSLHDALPISAATVVVPERVPLPGFAPSATVTFPVKPVVVFPCPSSAVTCTA